MNTVLSFPFSFVNGLGSDKCHGQTDRGRKNRDQKTVDDRLLIQLSGKNIDIVFKCKSDISPFREEASDDRVDHRDDLKKNAEQKERRQSN